MLEDLRAALRQLIKNKTFTATAVITLALGVGATTAIFTLVQQVMLKPLPVERPQELWRIGDKNRCCNWGGYAQGEDQNFALFSWDAYKHFREHTPEFTDLAALEAGNSPLGVRRVGSTAPVDTRNGQHVSGNFFRTLGVKPLMGRMLTDADDQEGAPLVAVMSYHVWREKYGSDPSVVGAVYQIDEHPFTVIGVTPPGFYGAKLSGWGTPDFWLPITAENVMEGQMSRLKEAQENYLDLLGRVRPSVTPQALDAKLKVELHNWLASHVADMEPGEKQLWQQQTLHLTSGAAGVAVMRDEYQDGLKLLLIAAGCVLLVACGDLANLMLARGLRERTEMSVRMALGAPRSRLIRKAFVESLTLAVLGGAMGVVVAYAGTRMIVFLAFHSGSSENYVPVNAAPSLPVLLFTLGISILTGLIFGIAPAWTTSHAKPQDALRGANRSVGGGSSWAQKSLVIAQTTMSLVLLSSAALLGRSLDNLKKQDFGFEPRGRYVVSMNPRLSSYTPEQIVPLYQRIDDRLRLVPGVKMVAPVLYGPLTGNNWNTGIRILGRPEPNAKEDTGAGWARAMPGFFETIGAHLQAGRSLTEEDTATTRQVAVVNEAFARRFFKGKNAVGEHFGLNRLRYAGTYEIVGVVKDVRYVTWGFKEPVGPMFWVSETQWVQYDDPKVTNGDRWSHMLDNIIVWAPGDPKGMEERIRKGLAEVDPNLVVYGVDPYTRVISDDFQQQNMIAILTTLFGGLALVLAAVGLYGVMAYTVEQRTNEIGLRMALGANRGHMIAMVLRGAGWQVGIGLALGIPLAIMAGRLMTAQLFGVSPWDPLILAEPTVLLGLAALFATAIPAQRAASVEPMTALRGE